ncbi:hypothetical protein HUU05_22120 [candidate division KSB1 bacterium]|nr:hypothetical protein [candidate division KSB1 bacterium]
MLVIRQRAEQAGIALDVQVPAALPEFFGDQRAINQILVNLLTNAVKFTPQGGRVTLAIAHAADRFTLTVSDTGCGIPPDLLDRLGTPFFQVEQSLTRSHEGTGLGLALTKSLTAMHVNKRNGAVCNCAAFTGAPQYARQRLTPTVRRNVLLPDMFEPVISAISPNCAMAKSLHTRAASGSKGWPSARAESNGGP